MMSIWLLRTTFIMDKVFFQQLSLSSKDLLQFLGIPMTLTIAQHHRVYLAFMETRRQVPDSMKETLQRISELYIKTVTPGPNSLKFKQQLIDLKKQMNHHAVHIRLISKSKMNPEIKKKIQESVCNFIGR